MFRQSIRKIAVLIGTLLAFSVDFPTVSYAQETSDLRTLNALRILQQRAEAGNVEAQYNLGYVYWKGIGFEQDYAKAVEWIEKAAFHGNSSAEDALGTAYSSGMGSKNVDLLKAKEWIQRSALKGNDAGQAHLGEIYYRGAGVDKDCHQAKYWLEKSSAQGNSEAEFVLGGLYERGDCVEQDRVKALDLYKKACDGDDEDGCADYKRLKASLS